MKNLIIMPVQKNIVGAIAGGVALYFLAKKVGHVQNTLAVVGIAVIGAVLGAHIQSSLKGPSITAKA